MAPDALLSLPPERRWRSQPYPMPVVVALIQRETAEAEPCYLLIQRAGETYSGQWALVGGKWDFGETLAAAIEREVREETGLDAAFVAVRGLVSERLLPPDQQSVVAHFLIFVCELAAPRGQAEERAEGPVDWFTWAEIQELQTNAAIVPSDYAMIQRFAGAAVDMPHVEAEMVADIGVGPDQVSQLIRFEKIDGRSP